MRYNPDQESVSGCGAARWLRMDWGRLSATRHQHFYFCDADKRGDPYIGVGAIAGLIPAVSSRAALGHTNRPLRAGALASAAFLLINFAALVRVVASALGLDLIVPAAALWILAFTLFGLRFAPILIGPSAR